MVDHGSWLGVATVLFFVWSVLLLIVRVWVKVATTRSWGANDWAIVAAYVITIGNIASVFQAISDGYGHLWTDLTPTQLSGVSKALYANGLLYILAVGLSRCSVSLFIASLTRSAAQIRQSNIITGISVAWTLAAFLLVALRGDLARPWTQVDGSSSLYVRWIIVETIGLGLELALFLLAGSLVWMLNMSITRRILISLAFAFRLLVVPIVAVRLYYLRPDYYEDQSTNTGGIVADILTQAVLEFSLIAASITCLKPFLKPFYVGQFVDAEGFHASGGLVSGAYDPYRVLSHDRSINLDSKSYGLRPDVTEMSCSASGGGAADPRSGAASPPAFDGGRDDRGMVIKQSRVFNVKQVVR